MNRHRSSDKSRSCARSVTLSLPTQRTLKWSFCPSSGGSPLAQLKSSAESVRVNAACLSSGSLKNVACELVRTPWPAAQPAKRWAVRRAPRPREAARRGAGRFAAPAEHETDYKRERADRHEFPMTQRRRPGARHQIADVILCRAKKLGAANERAIVATAVERDRASLSTSKKLLLGSGNRRQILGNVVADQALLRVQAAGSERSGPTSLPASSRAGARSAASRPKAPCVRSERNRCCRARLAREPAPLRRKAAWPPRAHAGLARDRAFRPSALARDPAPKIRSTPRPLKSSILARSRLHLS